MCQLQCDKKAYSTLHTPGFFATCEIVLFSETVTFDTAIEKCKNFNIGMATAQQGMIFHFFLYFSGKIWLLKLLA